MNFRRTFSPEAEADLSDIYEYFAIEKDSVSAAENVLSAIEEAADAILDRPLGYIVVEPPEGSRRILPFELRKRTVIKYSYLIFYTVVEDEVRILRVFHGAQDWASVLFGEM